MTLAERLIDAMPEAGIETRPCAVAWLDDGHANVVTMGADGRIAARLIERGSRAETSYLAEIVRAIGDRERVMILGPGRARLELEREYVAIHQRPDRLVDVEPSDQAGVADLIERLRTLSR
jgi:hypothetical protein